MLFRTAPSSPRRKRRGFTLIEAATTMVIIGVGCVAMLELLASGTMANQRGTERTIAINLAGNVREAMTGLYYAEPGAPTHWGPEPGETTVANYDDLDDFDNWTSSPGTPINAKRRRLPSDYSTWVQQVKVESVQPDNLSVTVPHLTKAPDMRPTCRITVNVLHNGRQVYSQSWFSAYADKSAPTTVPSTP